MLGPPTVGTYNKNVETHIFNFDRDLYGKKIRVEFIKKTREELKFESVEALSAQIKSDCIAAKAYHRERECINNQKYQNKNNLKTI